MFTSDNTIYSYFKSDARNFHLHFL